MVYLVVYKRPKSFTIANFGHPVSKSWLRPCHASKVNIFIFYFSTCALQVKQKDFDIIFIYLPSDPANGYEEDPANL